METEAPPKPTVSHDPVEPPRHASEPKHTMGPMILVVASVIALAVLLIVGVLPRLKNRQALAEGVKDAKSNVVEVTVAKPRFVRDPGLTLPGNIEAKKETTINARSTGYLRQLNVDIGSRVKAGEVLAIVQAPDTDQQFKQAEAQAAQAGANVGQAQATVEQQQATVLSDQATVAHNAAAVKQAQQGVDQAKAQEAQSAAAEKGTEAALAHSQQALDVQKAAMRTAQAQLDLAKVSNDRYQQLYKEGFDSEQDADTAMATYKSAIATTESAQASVTSAEADIVTAQQTVASAKAAVVAAQANTRSMVENVKAAIETQNSSVATVSAAKHTVRADVQTVHANQAANSAAEANMKLFGVMRGFEKVVAPFDGIVTARNVDVGTLITAGGPETGVTTSVPQTGMLGLAETDIVRIQINVPQTYAAEMVEGSPAKVSVRELPHRTFTGVVKLKSGGLDPTSRTELTEIWIANPDGALVTGMYAEAKIAPLVPLKKMRIIGTALVVDANGTRVAIVKKDKTVHFQKVEVGRDFGQEVEILRGLKGRETLVNNPPDTLAEGQEVKIVATPQAAGKGGRGAAGAGGRGAAGAGGRGAPGGKGKQPADDDE